MARRRRRRRKDSIPNSPTPQLPTPTTYPLALARGGGGQVSGARWWGRKRNSSLRVPDLHVHPPLPVEDRRHLEPAHPRLHRVQLVVEEQVHHRRVAERERVG